MNFTFNFALFTDDSCIDYVTKDVTKPVYLSFDFEKTHNSFFAISNFFSKEILLNHNFRN